MDAEDYGMMIENAQMFQVSLVPVGSPDAWAELPDPDAIFVGGSGRMVPELVQKAVRLRRNGYCGQCFQSDNLVAVQAELEKADLQPEVRMII